MILFLLLALCSSVNGNWQAVLPWQAKTTLLQLSEQLNIQSIRDDPLPIYRNDLDKDYIAYWYLTVNVNDYLIISSGPKTGDFKLIVQGTNPSLIDRLNEIAAEKKTKCTQFFMLTPSPDVQISCLDNTGEMQFVQKNIMLNGSEVDDLWSKRRENVEKERIWERSFLSGHTTHLRLLTSGEDYKFAIGDSLSATIHSLNSNQKNLCKVLALCHPDDQFLVDGHHFETTAYGQLFLRLRIPENLSETFEMALYTEDKGNLFGQKFVINNHQMSKRDSSSGPWTYYSIPDEELFPDYKQHDINCHKGWLWNTNKIVCCAIGCGPVAWAMILGYFDRRSHERPSIYDSGSQGLYGCGIDAGNGSDSCEAPRFNDGRVEKLTEHLAEDLGTFCLQGQGATTQGSMEKFGNYFKSHQLTGNPNVTVHTNGISSFVGSYSDDIRDKALGYLREKWPVVVGIKLSGIFSQHYPVATRYRQRSKKECPAGASTDTECTTSTEYEMYLHMGWGGHQNGWRVAQMFMAGVARY